MAKLFLSFMKTINPHIQEAQKYPNHKKHEENHSEVQQNHMSQNQWKSNK